jgi:hypothetical protein
MAYDLSNLLSAHNLEQLDAYFSQEEIDLVIKEHPNNNAPGPDGFNGLFIKRWWHIIRDDFTRLFTSVLIMLTSEESIHPSLH